MLTTGSAVASATAFRVGLGCLGIVAQRSRPLMELAVEASVGGSDRSKAQAEFRDDFIALARDSAEVTWRELRRGVDDLDVLTRPHEPPGARPFRPHRVKL